MNSIPISAFVLAMLLGCAGTVGAQEPSVVSMEVRGSINGHGGGACVLKEDGSIIYRRVLPNRQKGHGMVEKRYQMAEGLRLTWNELQKKFSLRTIVAHETTRKFLRPGETSFTLLIKLSDGTTMKGWGTKDDPIYGLWNFVSERAWKLADAYVPLLLEFKGTGFETLQPETKTLQQGGGAKRE